MGHDYGTFARSFPTWLARSRSRPPLPIPLLYGSSPRPPRRAKWRVYPSHAHAHAHAHAPPRATTPHHLSVTLKAVERQLAGDEERPATPKPKSKLKHGRPTSTGARFQAPVVFTAPIPASSTAPRGGIQRPAKQSALSTGGFMVPAGPRSTPLPTPASAAKVESARLKPPPSKRQRFLAPTRAGATSAGSAASAPPPAPAQYYEVMWCKYNPRVRNRQPQPPPTSHTGRPPVICGCVVAVLWLCCGCAVAVRWLGTWLDLGCAVLCWCRYHRGSNQQPATEPSAANKLPVIPPPKAGNPGNILSAIHAAGRNTGNLRDLWRSVCAARAMPTSPTELDSYTTTSCLVPFCRSLFPS